MTDVKDPIDIIGDALQHAVEWGAKERGLGDRPPLAVELVAWLKHQGFAIVEVSFLDEVLEWMIGACRQGTGSDPFAAADQDDKSWHMFMSTWEEADDLLPQLRSLIQGDQG